ncbi:hypothetical protein CPB86DRAFT_791758, partial [Serendipita vermifera]
MVQTAGIALGRLTCDAEFAICHNAARYPDKSIIIYQKLVNCCTVEDIIDTLHNAIGFDARYKYNAFMVSIPIGASTMQNAAFSFHQISHAYWCNHFHAWASLYSLRAEINDLGWYNLLFVDLTLGQEASKFSRGCITHQGWLSETHEKENLKEDVSSLSLQSIYDRLVTSVVPSGMTVHKVGILRPEGALPGVSCADLESMFLDTPIQWVTLDGLANGADFAIHQEQSINSRNNSSFPTRIMLANGKLVTVIPEDEDLHTQASVFFTTSQDNQTTATAKVYVYTTLVGEVKLEGLTPRSKGEARIKVELSIGVRGNAKIMMQELGTNLKAHKDLGMIPFDDSNDRYPDYDYLWEENSIEEVELT